MLCLSRHSFYATADVVGAGEKNPRLPDSVLIESDKGRRFTLQNGNSASSCSLP